METIDVADGRHLAYEVVGDPAGVPVLFQHGTGDSRLCKHPDDAVTAALGIEQFVVAGHSGGGPHALAVAAKLEGKHYRKDLHGFVARCAKEWPADAKIFTDPVLEPMFEAEFDAAFAQGGVGALDDMWAFLEWGFAPEEVPQHVELFVGDADDILDPEMSDRLSQRLPDCTEHKWPGAGHYGVYGCWEEFLGALV